MVPSRWAWCLSMYRKQRGGQLVAALYATFYALTGLVV